MKRLYQIACCLLLGAMLLVGVVSLVDKDPDFSLTENRGLAQRPKLTISALLDGTYFEALELYYADTFPGREKIFGGIRRVGGVPSIRQKYRRDGI